MSRYTVPKITIPEEIHLPDGRRFKVKLLTNNVKDKTNVNLRSKRAVKIPDYTAKQPYKYSLEERVWQSQATAEEIQERYAISLKTAQGIYYTSRYIVEKLGLDSKDKE